ncbi:MAG: sulfotransferase [Gammaproteobacteria bacterium]|nr:sulfotransferase [Gammaproteobacteria bacterium]
MRRVAWSGQTLKRPIFVVGCSRAGTTLVYKTLSVSRQLGSLQRETHDFWSELNPLPEREWISHCVSDSLDPEGDRNQVSRYFYEHLGNRRIVDKCNQNGMAIPYLNLLFPDAMFVFIKRAPGDNLLSLMEGWRRPGEYATWSQALPAEVAIEDGTFRDWCFFLPPGWREYLSASLAEVCAFQYIEMNAAILDASADVSPERWHEVAYEDLLTEPVGEFAKMYAACGVDFDAEVEEHCRTVIERPYNAFSEIKPDKWKESADADAIERILPSMNDVAARLGY